MHNVMLLFLGFVILIEPFADKAPTVFNPIMHFRYVLNNKKGNHLCIVQYVSVVWMHQLQLNLCLQDFNL